MGTQKSQNKQKENIWTNSQRDGGTRSILCIGKATWSHLVLARIKVWHCCWKIVRVRETLRKEDNFCSVRSLLLADFAFCVNFVKLRTLEGCRLLLWLMSFGEAMKTPCITAWMRCLGSSGDVCRFSFGGKDLGLIGSQSKVGWDGLLDVLE